ncbi:MAG: class I SAM-dependent methyltransferase [Alphaproteobacteria bacterium]|nr:class I SAM-dependent methyltransferase [Alphaproteobacteria bacterium]
MKDPSPWICQFADLVPQNGPVLDLACGSGRHSRFFLDRGHPVTAIDRDVEALEPRDGLEILPCDLEDGSPWPLDQRRFAAVVVVNYLYRPLLPLLVRAVAPGGLLLYDTFAVGNEAFGRPSNPEFLLRPDELPAAVEGELAVLDYFHGRIETPKPAMRQQICARRI